MTAGTLTPRDSLALFSARSRHPRFIRIQRVTHDPHTAELTVYLAEGPPMRFMPSQHVAVAQRTGMR